jgi:hypothetical protein
MAKLLEKTVLGGSSIFVGHDKDPRKDIAATSCP